MKICVFCSASQKLPEHYVTYAYEFGKKLAEKGFSLVYGGSTVGMMGAVANGALSAKGEVIGVIPQFLKDREIQHSGLTQSFLTDGMHERKQMMYNLADAFAVLPGGYGTLDESFEVITWNQLGRIKKPIYFINYQGFFDFIETFHQRAEADKFIKSYEHYQVPILKNDEEFFTHITAIAPQA